MNVRLVQAYSLVREVRAEPMHDDLADSLEDSLDALRRSLRELHADREDGADG